MPLTFDWEKFCKSKGTMPIDPPRESPWKWVEDQPAIPTLRDLFALNAPVEPGFWFVPKMPPAPKIPNMYVELTEEERAEFNGWEADYEDLSSDKLRTFAEAHSDAYEEKQFWENEKAKQRLIQWPYAWADEQLKAREA